MEHAGESGVQLSVGVKMEVASSRSQESKDWLLR